MIHLAMDALFRVVSWRLSGQNQNWKIKTLTMSGLAGLTAALGSLLRT